MAWRVICPISVGDIEGFIHIKISGPQCKCHVTQKLSRAPSVMENALGRHVGYGKLDMENFDIGLARTGLVDRGLDASEVTSPSLMSQIMSLKPSATKW
jgi:hypothetical protein